MGSDRIAMSISILSDATGQTAEAVVQAVTVQFPRLEPRIRRFRRVRTQEQVLEALDEAMATARGEAPRLIIYSLVDPDLRAFARREGKKRELPLFDLLGPLLGKVRRLFRLMPLSQPGLFEHEREESLRMAAAIDFTVKHDDGLGLESIHEADVVLLGISRTSKTPTSIYLACNHALKVANIPLFPERDLPRELLAAAEVPRIGLTIQPERLSALRREYIDHLREYTDPREIARELEHAQQVFRRLPGIRVIDVTSRSVEETSARIVEALAEIAGRA